MSHGVTVTEVVDDIVFASTANTGGTFLPATIPVPAAQNEQTLDFSEPANSGLLGAI